MTDDIFWLAINLYHEGRGEPIEGQEAIGHVCYNRADRKRKSIKEVVLQPYQFSWHNGNKFPVIAEYNSLLACLKVAEEVAVQRAQGRDKVNGADHYFADYIDPPEWSKSMKKICKIGRHTFFKS